MTCPTCGHVNVDYDAERKEWLANCDIKQLAKDYEVAKEIYSRWNHPSVYIGPFRNLFSGMGILLEAVKQFKEKE